ncbi:MAG TPA: hypothetical protein VJT67_02800 [Longimicrobiaceae bacterium]|nr:hypothetical protein [Longimicrobiaceae bacterium]
MAETRLPDDVRALVQSHLASMAHLDALLLLAGAPDASFSRGEVASRISAAPDAAAKALADLEGAKLAASEGTGDAARYRFAPADASLRRTAGTLADMYKRFPVQVIRAVYERPASPVQQLADAFRLR